MMTITRRAFFLLPIALFAFVPTHFAHAQLSTTQTNASPQVGLTIFNYPDQHGNPYADEDGIQNNTSFINAIIADIQATTPSITSTEVKNDGFNQQVSGGADDTITANRLCYVIDTTFGAGANAQQTYISGDNNTGQNKLKYSGGVWSNLGSGPSWHFAGLTCKSYALPQPTFSASSYSINLGQSVTLTWDDSTSRDYNSGYTDLWSAPIGPNGEYVVGGDISVLRSDSNANCVSSSNWSNKGLTGGHWSRTPYSCGLPGEPSICYNNYWSPDNTTTGEVKKPVTVNLASGTATYTAATTTSPTVTTDYTYTCTNNNGTVTKTAHVVVNGATPKPDLTAGAITPTTANQSTAKTFSATISNTGTATTGAGSTALFQTANAISGTSAVGAIGDAGTDATIATLANGTSDTASFSYSTTTTGTIYMRACADKSSAGNAGVIAESDETNNCGAWTGIVVASATPMPDYTSVLAPTISTSTPTTGSAVTFTGKVKNSGTAAASVASEMAIQIDTGLAGSTYTSGSYYLPSSATAVSALAAGATSGSISPTSGWVPTTAGTYKARVCGDYTGVIAESNEGNNCGPDLQFTVTAGSPDLTAGAVTPTTATQNTAKTFSSTVTNTGTAGTGATFTTLFQKASDASGTGSADIGTASMGILAGQGTAAATLSYTFTTAGTFYMRACADKSSAGNAGVIAESNASGTGESNNCGAWTGVTVSAAAAAQCNDGIDNDGDGKIDYPADPGCTSIVDNDETDPSGQSVSCTPSPASGDTSTSYTYTAVSSGFTGIGTTKYTWTDANGTPASQGPGISATFATTYGSTGSFAAHVHAFRAAQSADADCSPVAVGSMCGTTPSPTISSSVSRVVSGGTVHLNWSASGVNTSCVVSGPNIVGGTKTSTASSCNVADGGGANATVTTQSTYCIVCDGDAASKACVTVDVAPKIIEF